MSIPSFKKEDRKSIFSHIIACEDCHCIDKDGFFSLPYSIGPVVEVDYSSDVKGSFAINNGVYEGALAHDACDFLRLISMDVPFHLWIQEDSRWGVQAVYKSTKEADSNGLYTLEFPQGFPCVLTGMTTKRISCVKMPTVLKVIGEFLLADKVAKLFDNNSHFAMQDSNNNFVICSNGCAAGMHKTVPFSYISNIIGFDPEVLDRWNSRADST